MDTATQSMIDNLPKNTGRSLDEWFDVLAATGLDSHTALMNYLKQERGISHGFANGIVLQYRSRATDQSADALVDTQLSGPKSGLRPIYDALVEAAVSFGSDVEVAPKKASVSLRRHKQFALIEAPSAGRIQLGVNLPGLSPTDRLLPAGGMCSHKVSLASVDDMDGQVLAWLRAAYDRA
ncbi:DUF4287 domain-containing protein [Glaciibacter sp. 2TAF33]|uniref:DUF4287 domain-containing protein n=1 Tax=Glaciibacter sp. 2TAF33 TaxID=3233015 RepID=UPI003F901737